MPDRLFRFGCADTEMFTSTVRVKSVLLTTIKDAEINIKINNIN